MPAERSGGRGQEQQVGALGGGIGDARPEFPYERGGPAHQFPLPAGGTALRPSGVGGQRPELQPGGPHERRVRGVGGQRDGVPGLLEAGAESGVRGDVAVRTGRRDEDLHDGSGRAGGTPGA